MMLRTPTVVVRPSATAALRRLLLPAVAMRPGGAVLLLRRRRGGMPGAVLLRRLRVPHATAANVLLPTADSGRARLLHFRR